MRGCAEPTHPYTHEPAKSYMGNASLTPPQRIVRRQGGERDDIGILPEVIGANLQHAALYEISQVSPKRLLQFPANELPLPTHAGIDKIIAKSSGSVSRH